MIVLLAGELLWLPRFQSHGMEQYSPFLRNSLVLPTVSLTVVMVVSLRLQTHKAKHMC